MLDLRPIPANVSSTAAAKLPRFLLLAILILFIVLDRERRGRFRTVLGDGAR